MDGTLDEMREVFRRRPPRRRFRNRHIGHRPDSRPVAADHADGDAEVPALLFRPVGKVPLAAIEEVEIGLAIR